MNNTVYFDCLLGTLKITEENGFITGVSKVLEHEAHKAVGEKTVVLNEALKQLGEYFDGKRQGFDVPILLKGTEFQKKVWQALREVPYGKTCSYADIASAVDNKKACRAVGLANNKNPILILVPCHRVVGKNGKLVGFALGLEAKKSLLKIEGIDKDF